MEKKTGSKEGLEPLHLDAHRREAYLLVLLRLHCPTAHRPAVAEHCPLKTKKRKWALPLDNQKYQAHWWQSGEMPTLHLLL